MASGNSVPSNRYDASLANVIELKWQKRWEDEGTYHTPNPSGPLASSSDRINLPKLFIMDMFPYPSGTGLHVGHPLGFIGTDVYARYKRMTGYNVLHTMGYDAFGLPAEEHARQTGQHPRENTNSNIDNMRGQLRRLGLGHDQRRSVATTDLDYYRWTQWIFLQLFNSWYDHEQNCARPISELEKALSNGSRALESGILWDDLSNHEKKELINSFRLAYLDEAPVNWCPALGTVLANEEVTAEGRSERGNHLVYRRPLKQWMMRITAYADRLLEDLENLDWSDAIKTMQRNWIGKSKGAEIVFPISGEEISVFTTRPDTLFGATYMVLAPEHPLIEKISATSWPDGTPEKWLQGFSNPQAAIESYQQLAAQKSDLDRQENKEKTGVFLGVYATVPVNNKKIPVFISDYVLMGYGTGAIMAVPGQDERDWEFAELFNLEIVRTVEPPPSWDGKAFPGDGPAINSDFLNGLGVDDAKSKIIDWLVTSGNGTKKTTYKLRDWLFSRQRYWGEPFPIVYGDDGLPIGVDESHLPVELPDLIDWAPRSLEENSEPEPPLGRSAGWGTIELNLGNGLQTYKRELNTMPQWAGSCWYYLRYLDPTNDDDFVAADIEQYWMSGDVGGVDLYVGGVEHAVLHLLYSRFWHKVLYDLGHVSSLEPFQRLYNQGYIQAAAYQDTRGIYVEAAEVTEENGGFVYKNEPVTRSFGKMGKSLKNSVTPDEMYDEFGADTLRLYEMFMGPLDQDRPWETKSVVGSQRLIQRVWRNLVDEETGNLNVSDEETSKELLQLLHRTIQAVNDDMENLRFNTAIARITELNNEITKIPTSTPRKVAETLVLLLSPLAPHIAEELWEKLGNETSVVYAPFPEADKAFLIEDSIEIPIQINGKVKSKIIVPSGSTVETIRETALQDPKINSILSGEKIRKEIIIEGKLVNFVF
ncbi:MAG: leucine--tRNA ligase [Acidimicrobiales bacterium]|jgi:leucyl-tRNA synthetase|nr:leucine--tRNA ligase [Acidimicrobiales bacterium]MDP6299040.1 leucine--tRNA ligase [Acidimicrobiales bacterium]HJM28778.1 leucine--tRNA ligase [Acidimicrobiales bacterium]HJM98192.1 leucine--tRNA ligase [Acidimicrobiales bacterium]